MDPGIGSSTSGCMGGGGGGGGGESHVHTLPPRQPHAPNTLIPMRGYEPTD